MIGTFTPWRARRLAKWYLVLGAALAAGGCKFGPTALELTHGPYNEAVKEVMEEQLLLNIVRHRYNDDSERLGVGTIATQYSLGSAAEARPFFAAPNPAGTLFRTFTRILPDVTVSASNLPTITMVPHDDPETIRNLYAPTSLNTLLFLTETGYPVSTIFGMWISGGNSANNAEEAGGPPRDLIPGYQDYRRAVALMQVLHDRVDIHFHREEKKTAVGSPLPKEEITAAALVEAAKAGLQYEQWGNDWVLTRKESKLVLRIKPQVVNSPEVAELCHLLNLAPGRLAYDIEIGWPEEPQFAARQPPEPANKLTVQTRSVIQAVFFAAHGVVVPPEHLAGGQAQATLYPDGTLFDWQDVLGGLFTVYHAKRACRPKHAWVAIKYHGYWFYVDDRDQNSKVTFTLLLTMVRANLVRGKEGPVLTLPVGVGR